MLMILLFAGVATMLIVALMTHNVPRGGTKVQRQRYDHLISRHDLRQPEIDEVRQLYEVLYPEGYRHHQENAK